MVMTLVTNKINFLYIIQNNDNKNKNWFYDFVMSLVRKSIEDLTNGK